MKSQGGPGSVHCFHCEPENEGDWLKNELAAELGVAASLVLNNPLAYLEPVAQERREPVSASIADGPIDGWCSRLLASEWLLDLLRTERGLTPETIRRRKLGYDGDANAITIPIPDEAGEWINVRRRFLDPDAKPKIAGLAGRPSSLYPLPILADDPRSVVLAEGELDALLLNQLGIPAISSTAGTSWKPEWNKYVAGRQVCVLYDAGSYAKGVRRADELKAAGARWTWAGNWEREGFRRGDDVTTAVVEYGWTADDLRTFIRDERRRGR